MNTSDKDLKQENSELDAVASKGLGAKLALYTRKSGPGWLQGAITLGGGSLAGALYLGVVMGYNMMWLQPLAMILGVIMLSAISYVTLSTGGRPLQSINQHVSPVLGWAWIIATLMANIVWCMPQFNLGRAAIQQNLLPSIGSGNGSTIAICVVLFVVAFVINFFYESGSKGIKLFEIILKAMVGIVVLSFFGVVVAMSVKGSLNWGEIMSGFIPDLSLLSKPAPTFDAAIAATGGFADFWREKIAADQRDIMITAFGTAVGINMTFLLPYSMLKKRWGKSHRGLAIFDLSIGLIVPFVLCTACVVIASASQFHTKYNDVLNEDGSVKEALVGAFNGIADTRIKSENPDITADALPAARDALPKADRELSAMLAKRDNLSLAAALEPLTGKTVAQTVFGIGVLGMALSTIIILMLINGFTLCEMFGCPGNRTVHLIGAAISGIGGFMGPFVWKGASAAALAIPTSVIGGAMIPIAYFTFLLLMNSRSLLGIDKPTGGRAIVWNILMLIATSIATYGSLWVLNSKGTMGKIGIGALIALMIIGLIGFISKNKAAARKS